MPTYDNNNNIITGTAGADVIFSLGGNDRIEGLAGADTIDGGTGSDVASYVTSTAGVQIQLADRIAQGGHADGDVLISIEGIIGSNFADFLAGDAGANNFSGENGNDIIEGGGGADVIDGGAFADADTVTYFGSSAGVTVNLATSSGSGEDAQGGEIYNVENIQGSGHNDILIGNSGVNILAGNAGNETLTGSGGNDKLFGGLRNDTAVFAGTRASANITLSGRKIIVTSADRSDTLKDIEFMRFSDQTVSVQSLFPSLGPAIQVTTFDDIVDPNDGVISLREAVTQANAAGVATNIQLGTGGYNLSNNNFGDLNITGSITLRGAGVGQIILVNSIDERTLSVHNGAVFNLENISLRYLLPTAKNVMYGGALYNDGGTVHITNTSFEYFRLQLSIANEETAQGDPKSIFLIKTSYSPSEGGAVFNNAGTMGIVGSYFKGNVATHGGALANNRGSVTVDATVFDGNEVYHSAFIY